MISKFNLYVVKLFAKYTVIVQLFVAVISLIANTFQHTKYLTEYNISFLTLVAYDLLKTPYLLYSTMPITIVIATMFVMITLLKSNELLAYVSLGGKIRNLAIPFVTGGVALALIMVFMANSLNPKVMYIREKFSSENIKKKKFVIKGKLTDLWLKENDQKFINMGLIDSENGKIIDVTEYHINEDFNVENITQYDMAQRSDDKWTFKNVRTFKMSPVPKIIEQHEEQTFKRELFDELTSLPVMKPKYLSIAEIRRIKDIMKRQNLSATKYEIQLYKIYAHVLSVIVIILTIFPLCVGFGRNHSYINVAGKSILTGLGFWMLKASSFSLGKTGLLNPFISNFLPIIVFTIIATLLIYSRERGK